MPAAGADIVWCSPYAITYKYAQITWILRNINMVREGEWPDIPDKVSGYIDPQIVAKSGEYEAYTETIAAIAGTIERRLAKSVVDGFMAYLHFTAVLSYPEIGRGFHLSGDEVYKRVTRAMKYCVGKKEKQNAFYSTPEKGGLTNY